ncbi:hypothetical protein V5O48_005454 [Marasmius crinis-equi]|uniref:Uncharacterized protein n=1 Tax=Marasmius crinis-equi TaxID=585013 RepID=A0ABR3FM88_9AGAR
MDLKMQWMLIVMALDWGILVPLGGALVRWRAHYNPKRIHIRGRVMEGQQLQEETISPIRGYFSILRRVHDIEGIPGFYKGLVPSILSDVCTMLLVEAFFSEKSSRLGDADNDTASYFDINIVKRMLYWILRTAIGIPLEIVKNRAITTPYRLPWGAPIQSLNVLLSQSERHSLWRLYLIPGFVLARVVLLELFWYGVGPIRDILIPEFVGPQSGADEHYMKSLACFFLFNHILCALVQTPLEVALVRLSVQKYHDTEGVSRDKAGSPFARQEVELKRYSDEKVIRLKDTDLQPYKGLVDCLYTILVEEGWKTMFKSGWRTLFGM